jgi:hypothetical protein
LRKGRYFFKPSVLTAIVNEFQGLILQLGLVQDEFSVYDVEQDKAEWDTKGPSFLQSYGELNIDELIRGIGADILSGDWTPS